MNSKELLIKTLKNEKTDRIPWVPFVGVHGGKLIEKNAIEYLKSGELIAEGILKAIELYKPDGIPILFDLQMEAEILGCELRWAEKVPPSVISHPLEKINIDDLPKFDTTLGRFPQVKEAITLVKEKVKDEIALYGLITGPFTLALHLYGNNIFLDMLMNPAKIKEVLQFCTDIAIQTAEFYLENGIDVIAVVDPMTSQISPQHFIEFVTPYVNNVFDFIAANEKLSSFFVCGNATRNLEEMCKTNCHNISIDENISLTFLKELSMKYNKSFGGNLKLTSTLLFGSELDSQKNAIECMEIGGDIGFILAPGCDLPYDCPKENLIAVSEIVHDEYKLRIAKTLSGRETKESTTKIELPDYKKLEKLIIDVVTLDSGSCPPCFYMVDAVKKATKCLDEKVEIRERKISTKEGLDYMDALAVKAIPTICLDGDIAFSSIIPDQDTLQQKIAEYLK
jgi:uroporphyrinogen decarboxylase